MREIPQALRDELNSELSTLTYIVRVSRRDGVTFGFTTHDQDIHIPDHNLTYLANTAIEPHEAESSGDANVDNLSVSGILNSDTLTDEDLRAGRFDGARVDVYIVSWKNTDAIMHTGRYFIGEVTYSNDRYSAELLGLKELLQKETGRYITRTCSVEFGSSECGINLDALRVTGTVSHTGTQPLDVIHDLSRSEPDGYFQYGNITFTSGKNKGLTRDIKMYKTGYWQIWEPLPFPVEVGDHYSMVPGCDKTIESCGGKWDNILNFRGFPHVPGATNMLQYGGR